MNKSAAPWTSTLPAQKQHTAEFGNRGSSLGNRSIVNVGCKRSAMQSACAQVDCCGLPSCFMGSATCDASPIGIDPLQKQQTAARSIESTLAGELLSAMGPQPSDLSPDRKFRRSLDAT